MKLKALSLSLFLTGFLASLALAGSPAGQAENMAPTSAQAHGAIVGSSR